MSYDHVNQCLSVTHNNTHSRICIGACKGGQREVGNEPSLPKHLQLQNLKKPWKKESDVEETESGTPHTLVRRHMYTDTHTHIWCVHCLLTAHVCSAYTKICLG